MNKKLLALYSLKYNPFSSEIRVLPASLKRPKILPGGGFLIGADRMVGPRGFAQFEGGALLAIPSRISAWFRWGQHPARLLRLGRAASSAASAPSCADARADSVSAFQSEVLPRMGRW